MEVKNFEALKEAMKELCDFLAESDVPEDSVFDSKLVVSELVSNVLQHSDGVASLESEIRGEFIELKVRSSVRFCPPEESRCSEVYAESGRGLFIVDNVCTGAFVYGGRRDQSVDKNFGQGLSARRGLKAPFLGNARFLLFRREKR
ncbi:MAG: ATP-binding protein [Christensenellaceae bacterium]